ncbi:ISL3 family transposase [Enterococcus sp. AZ128]|uniref:ISL3 family transposase n=1 Tax=Enterococcus sp. AZ128 TaxID=2774630 RepID=UPI003F682E3F
MTKVCIDDFAIKKRQTYGTIMVDLESHKIVDLIPSRDFDDVKRWLETFPNLKIVCRDGSRTFKNAITASHPTATQISDRFHLIKNFSEYLKKVLKQVLPNAITVIESNSMRKMESHLSLKEKIVKAKKLIKSGDYSINRIAKELSMDKRTIEKYLSLSNKELDKLFMTKLEKQQMERSNQKQKLIKQVKQQYAKGISMRELSKIFNLNRKTIKKYIEINLNDTSLIQKRGRSREKTKPFNKEIQQLFQKGYTARKIFNTIKDQGFTGCESTIRNLVNQLKTIQTSKTVISRNRIIHLLYQPHLGDYLDQKQLVQLIIDYPLLGSFLSLFYQLQRIFRELDLSSFAKWFQILESSKLYGMDSFLTGIKRDHTAVFNAVKYGYSNGLAEGSVNKTKLIKRIMFGRNSFDLLRKKILLRKITF